MKATELSIKNRIALLKSRGEENGNIIAKLERKLRSLAQENE